MTVFEINALLYMPGHPPQPARARAAHPGAEFSWRASFQALLAQGQSGGATTGNAGLAPVSGRPPAWADSARCGSRTRSASSSVMSLVLEPKDGLPLPRRFPASLSCCA
jgi:hypothetical protein